MKIDATDIAAYIIIIGCLILIGFGLDGEVKSILAVAAGWAFRKPIKNGVKKITHKEE